jgi:hypothetical protein
MRTGVLLLLALGLAGCDDGYSIRWTRLSELPAGARLEPRLVRLPVETTIAARPTVTDNGTTLRCEPDIESADEDILFVEPSERGAFVFIGAAPGDVPLSVACGGIVFDIAGQVVIGPPR